MQLPEEELFQQVKRHLLKSRGVDLSGYSPSFVGRAIRKRISRTDIADYTGYVKLLMRSEEETSELLNALSINVTEFFRDRGAFESFQVKVLRPLLEGKIAGGGGILRIWSAGCATGQETYTIMMCLAEEARRCRVPTLPLMSVLGTDISIHALAKAKRGVYSEEEAKGVPDKYLAEYFVKKNGQYEVSDDLRKRVRFARENLLDAPSSKFFDAIVCRNVLIYFSHPMHDVVMQHLRDALRVEGYLMLGRTEALIGHMRGKFDVVDQENRILRKLV
jgi:chemotaxis methyl-accepting protein methylase